MYFGNTVTISFNRVPISADVAPPGGCDILYKIHVDTTDKRTQPSKFVTGSEVFIQYMRIARQP